MIIDPILDQALVWVLIFVRIISALAVMPVFSFGAIPMPVRIGLAGFIAFITFPLVTPPVGWMGTLSGVWGLIAILLPEILIGIIMGMVAHFIFYGVQLCGQFLGMQIGFAIANIVDPSTEEQVSIIAQLQFTFAMLIFLIFNGHHFLLSGILQTFETVPLGGMQFDSNMVNVFVDLCGNIYVSAVKIAAPVMAALFLSEVALGIIARTVPQMNVFLVGIPLKIGLGLLTMALSWPLFVYVFQLLWKSFEDDWAGFIALLSP
ncbi:flagellar biosynthetic protein FliR [bacterium]|nr:flagellar biosynthetic protein FliR [bacterium]